MEDTSKQGGVPEFNQKILFLEKMYRFYDKISRSFGQWKCGPGCSDCCTSLAVLTTLEAAFLWERFGEIVKEHFRSTRELAPPLNFTTNEQAELCINSVDFPEHNPPEVLHQCPLLGEGRCTVYEARPLMCRLMLSSVDCRKTGCAEIPSELLSLNTALLQIVEDLDSGGWSGYLVHLLPHFDDNTFLEKYAAGTAQLEDAAVRPNRANPGLLVPPEHQKPVGEWLDLLLQEMR